jgi:Na+/H+ antiporter NhaB
MGMAEVYAGDRPAVQAADLTKDFMADKEMAVKKYKLEPAGDNVLIIEGVVVGVDAKDSLVRLAGHKE